MPRMKRLCAVWRAVALTQYDPLLKEIPVKALPAVGYVRSPYPNARKHDEYVVAVESYADTHSMRLLCVFRDDGAPYLAAQRSGFTRVIAELSAGNAAAVIVPAVYHLSWLPEVRVTLTRIIQNAGGRLYIAQAPLGLASVPQGVKRP
jgi:hypothetical protein